MTFKPIKIKKPKPHVPLESTRTRQVLDFLNNIPGCKAQKRHQSGFGKRGEPDIVFCLCGRHGEIEMKRAGKEPSKLQLVRLAEWEKVGAIVGRRITCVDDVKQMFEDYGVKI